MFFHGRVACPQADLTVGSCHWFHMTRQSMCAAKQHGTEGSSSNILQAPESFGGLGPSSGGGQPSSLQPQHHLTRTALLLAS